MQSKDISSEAAKLEVVLRAKANSERFTAEERDTLRYAGAMIGKLGKDRKKMEIAIRAIFEWTRTDIKSTESRYSAMANLQGICSRVLSEIHARDSE